MNIKWNEYTWYSRLVAIIFFIAILPIWTFYIGFKYEETKQVLTAPQISYIQLPVTKKQQASTSTIDSTDIVDTASNTRIFTDLTNSYSFEYPIESVSVDQQRIGDPTVKAWTLPLLIKTQLTNKSFGVQTRDTCSTQGIPDTPYVFIGTKTIGDNMFTIHDNHFDAGSEYTQLARQYDVIHEGKCFEFSLSLAVPFLGVSGVPASEAFNVDAESKVMEQILSTLTFSK